MSESISVPMFVTRQEACGAPPQLAALAYSRILRSQKKTEIFFKRAYFTYLGLSVNGWNFFVHLFVSLWSVKSFKNFVRMRVKNCRSFTQLCEWDR